MSEYPIFDTPTDRVVESIARAGIFSPFEVLDAFRWIAARRYALELTGGELWSPDKDESVIEAAADFAAAFAWPLVPALAEFAGVFQRRRPDNHGDTQGDT